MSAPLGRLALRHYRAHPWQAGLALLGIALGVAVLVSIEAANGSALAAFRLSTEAVTGRATDQITGSTAGVPEDLFARLRLEAGIRPSTPVVEGRVEVRLLPGAVAAPGELPPSLRLLGLDPLTDGDFRSYLGGPAAADLDLAAFMTRPGAVVMEEEAATARGLEIGDRIPVRAAQRDGSLELVGLFAVNEDSTRRALTDLAIADLATAQEVLGLVGRLTRIDLILSREAAADRQTVRRMLPAGLTLESAGSRVETAAEMTRSFRLNLRALSLLALFCGAFLIYNTMTFSVLQRRHELGTLRALGVTRGEILRAVLLEAGLVGLAGTAIGVPAGLGLADGLLGQVTQTINDHYFVVSVSRLELAPSVLATGAILGVLGSMAGALAPALEAVRAAPRASLQRSELEGRTHRAVPRATVAGLFATASGGVLLLAPGPLAAGFLGFFLLLLGLACFLPLATLVLVRLLTPIAGLLAGNLGRMAARAVGASLSRTGIAIAALTIAVSVSVGVGLMIESFRTTVDRWLVASLPADLYVSPEAEASDRFSVRPPGLEPELVAAIEELPGVAAVNTVRQIEVELEAGGTRAPTRLLAYRLDAEGRGAIQLKEGEAAAAWAAVDSGSGVIVSEPLAYRRGIRRGDQVTLATPAGERRFEVAAIHYDYASERGAVLLADDLYERLWGDRLTTAASIYLAPGADADRTADAVRALAQRPDSAATPSSRVLVRSNAAILERSLEVFDRTFVVTRVLRLLALLVAAVGVLSALTALQLERAREIGVLRATGLTPGQVWGLVAAETGIMGLISGLLALPFGWLIAVVMVQVINRRSFGWTMELSPEPAALAAALLLALTAALVAGLYPAWRMSRLSPALALRGM